MIVLKEIEDNSVLINEITSLQAEYYQLSYSMQLIKKQLAELDSKLRDNLDLESEDAKSGN